MVQTFKHYFYASFRSDVKQTSSWLPVLILLLGEKPQKKLLKKTIHFV